MITPPMQAVDSEAMIDVSRLSDGLILGVQGADECRLMAQSRSSGVRHSRSGHRRITDVRG